MARFGVEICVVAVAVAGTAGVANPAAAAGFDTARGVVDVADADFAITFEDSAVLGSIQAYAFPSFDPVPAEDLPAQLRSGGIEQDGGIALGGNLMYALLDLGAADFAGKRTELVFWQKPLGTRVGASLDWSGVASEGENPPSLGSLMLFPTGNVTSDGWEEYSSGPFDWAWAGAFGPQRITFVDEGLYAAYATGAYDSGAFALVDALYVRVLGDAAVPSATCTLLDEATTCGDAGACHLGRCVDGALRAGARPPLDAQWRADYVDRRAFELDLFEGGRHPQARMDDALALLVAVRSEESPRKFWEAFADAYSLLEDGHASAPLLTYPAYANAGICLSEGQADLLDSSPVAPMVFQTSGDNPFSAQLQPGDVLLAIDGVAVASWVEAASRLITHHGDTDAKSVAVAPYILGAALDTGAVLTFGRCAGPDPCAADSETRFDLDLSTIGDDILAGTAVPAFTTVAPCDYRFLRPVAGAAAAVTAYEFADYDDDGGIRSLLINGVPSYYGQGGRHWFDVVESALSGPAPAKLLLDERTGNGGGVDAADWIAGFLLEQDALYAMDFLPSYDEGDDAATRDAVRACIAGQSEGYDCGSAFRWVLGEVAGPTRGTAAATKLAVLTAFDVSGNDYLTRLIKEREDGETRVFGPSDTLGAFGVIWSLAPHLGELSGGSFQVHDTLFLQSADDPIADFATSTGVPPDEVVRQKQSDALLGVDTTLAAARAWLEQP